MAQSIDYDNYLRGPLESLIESTQFIKSLQFKNTNVLCRAVLAPEEWYESQLIRDAQPEELALFKRTRNKHDTVEQVVQAGGGPDLEGRQDDVWIATTRKGPERTTGVAQASPLKQRKGNDDPARCLLAARKLLEIYPLPRYSAHVEALFAQYEGLLASIAEKEETLRRPLSRPNLQTAETIRAIELEGEIHREEMEIFAVEQIIAEQEAALASKKAAAARPTPRKSTGPLLSGSANPFAKSTKVQGNSTTPLKSRPSATSMATPPRSTPGPSTLPRSAAPATSNVASSSPRPGTPSSTPVRAAPRTPSSRETTPRAPRVAAVVGIQKMEKRPSGIPKDDLEAIATKVWSAVGDILKPWARKTLRAANSVVPMPLVQCPFDTTLETIATALAAPPAPPEPTSPGSITSSLRTEESEHDDDDPSPPSPALLVELELLNLLLSTLSGRTPIPSSLRLSPPSPPLAPLKITMRDAVLASSLATSPSSTRMGEPRKEEAMVSMNVIKAWLGVFAKERSWQEDMGTAAIYSMVSKTVLRIDRKGKEGPMLGFKL